MQWFDLLLLIKIGVTLVLVALPYLLLSDELLEQILGSPPKDRPLMRLYAIALIALCVAYGSALSWLRGPDFPFAIAIMGVVSNGGATLALLLDKHGRIERATAWFFGTVTVLLLLALAFPDGAMQPI